MQSAHDGRFSQALDLHRRGQVAAAKAIYNRLLAEKGEDADVIGLLGVVALQEGNRAEAERLWMQSLRLPCKPWVYIRNINNLATTLLEDRRAAEATQLLQDAEIPSWDGAEPPDGRQLTSILSLALCLRRAKLTKKARALLEPIGAALPDDRDAQTLLADVRLADEDFGAALEILERFADSDDLWTMTARLQCEQALGRQAEAEVDRRKVLQLASVHVCQGFRDDRKTILVLNSGEALTATGSAFDLHFSGNFPSQVAQALKDDFNFVSIFGDSEFAKLDGLRPHLVLNNIVNAEILCRDSTFRHDLAAVADSFGVPVINHPLRAAETTRQRVAFWLKDVDNLVAPRTLRFEVDGDALDAQVASLEAELSYPLIIRTTTSQRGVGMEKVDDRPSLIRELSARVGRQIYAHPFVDSRAGALFRKFRIAVVGEEIIPVRLDYRDFWKVHGRILPERKAFYRQRPHLLREEERLLAAPNEVLSERVLDTLREVRRRVPLDIFGVDFDVRPDGQVVFFEANASMYLLEVLGPDDADLFHPAAPVLRLQNAIKAYFERKMAEPAASFRSAPDTGPGPATSAPAK